MTDPTEPSIEYLLPARRLSGNRADVLAELDDLILALVAVRQRLAMMPEPIEPKTKDKKPPFRLVRTIGPALLALMIASPGLAQTTTAASNASPNAPAPLEHLLLGVTLEAFYQFNLNHPYDRVNLLRAYDTRANMFGLQQAAFILESAPDVAQGRRFGARVDLQFGQATETLQGSAGNEPRPDAYRYLWQAYGTYVFPVGRGLQTDFGKFASMLGYETNYAKDNSHFSRAYLFNFLPFYHQGLRLSLPVSDHVTLLYMLTNGVQQTEDFNNFKSNHVAAIAALPAHVTWTMNYYAGQEQPDGGLPNGPDGFFRVIDSYIAYTPTSTLSLAMDANYVSNEVHRADEPLSLQGTGLYARYQVSGAASLALRYERLADEGLFGGVDQTLHEVTVTTEYKFADGFLARGEFRRDSSNRDFFTTAQPGVRRDQQNTFTVGLIWWFGNKPPAW